MVVRDICIFEYNISVGMPTKFLSIPFFSSVFFWHKFFKPQL